MIRWLFGIAVLTLAVTAVKAQPAEYTISNKCVIANEQCFIIRVGSGGMSATDRVDRLNERLAYILGYERLAPGNIYIKMNNGQPTIFVGRSVLIEVTQADAEANGTTPLALAENWLANLRHAMPQSRPPS